MDLKQVILIIMVVSTLWSCSTQTDTSSVLVFSKTAGFRHKSIKSGITAIKKLGEANQFQVVATEDANYFTTDSLKTFDAIIFLNTTGDVLNAVQQDHFKWYINNGGGFVGIHAATDTEYDWPWYNKLVGAYFKTHPPGVHEAKIDILQQDHPATIHLPKRWTHTDEWYDFKSISPDITVLANLDESTYEGGGLGDNHPISWCQEFDGGKMFYTALGHPKEAYESELFLNHILGGIKYVLED